MNAMLIAFDKTVRSRWQQRLWRAAILVATLGAVPLHAVEPLPIEYLWQTEPRLDVPWFHHVEEYAPPANPAQIHSPSASQRMAAAQAIIRAPGNSHFDAPQLRQAIIERLEAGESQPNVRAELVAALCALDDGSAAERLWKRLGDDQLVLPILEQACIRWRKPLPLEIWRERLRNHQGSHQEIARALEGLGAAGSQEDLALLITAVQDKTQSAPLRLVAARAIGRLSTVDKLPLAKALRDSNAEQADLLAVEVLGKKSSAEIKEFMVDIADQGDPVAQRLAYQWLCELEPATAQAKAAAYSEHADAEIRRMSLLEINKTEQSEAIKVLSLALGDVHPALRELARTQLLSRSSRSADHQRAVEEAIAEGLKHSDWKTLEQCVRMTVELEQKVHVPRLIELLENPRPEVCITAAWALRHLATEEKSLAAMFEHAQPLVKRLQGEGRDGAILEEFELRRLAHLLEAFGKRRYQPAKATLLVFVPKRQSMGLITRMAGVWACGKMWEGEENRSLADQLCERIADKATMFPEQESVRYTATLALGYLADPETRQALVANNENKPTPIAYATEWALMRIDDKKAPE